MLVLRWDVAAVCVTYLFPSSRISLALSLSSWGNLLGTRVVVVESLTGSSVNRSVYVYLSVF